MKILKHCTLALALFTLSTAGFLSCMRGGTIDSITISPSDPVIATGTTQQFKARAHFTDGTNLNWTSAVNWTSSDSNTEMFNNVVGSYGIADPKSTGTFTITATDTANGISDSTTLTVADPISITVTPYKPYMAVGTTYQFTATALFSDISGTQNLASFATWTIDPSVATVSSTGLVTAGNAAGSTELVSTYTFTDISATTIVTVTQTPLTAISVTPADAFIYSNMSTQFTALGTFEDKSSLPLTESVLWSSSNPDVAVISNVTGSNGVATAGITTTGTTIITATDPITNKSGSFTLTVQ